MSGGSQHNPNGRQQMGPGWSPLQLQVANFLARAPQAHMASDRGVTWHTPTPPAHPHLYHVPTPSPPDPLQGLLQLQSMKNAGSTVFRHTATPPDHYRHTPTPPDKHLLRHTPSPGDVKAGAPLLPAELYPHLGPGRDKLVRQENLLAYARGGVDLSLGGARSAANGSSSSPAPSHPASPALSVRDAPTINNLISRVQPRMPHARVDALLERLAPSPVSPHSVIMHSRAAPTPSPPSSNEDSADSCGAPPGSKRKRKPERTIRVPSVPPPLVPPTASELPRNPDIAQPASRVSPPPKEKPQPVENGDTPHEKSNGPDPANKPPTPQPEQPHAKRKERSGSSETIDDIAAMIASTNSQEKLPEPVEPEPSEMSDAPATVDKLESVLASPEPARERRTPEHQAVEKTPPRDEPPRIEKPRDTTPVEAAVAAPKRRRSTRNSNSDSVQATNVPVESPSEAKPAEPEGQPSAEPAAASFVEVENQLEKMFAGIGEPPSNETEAQTSKSKPRRKSAPTKGETKKVSRRSNRMSLEDKPKKKGRKVPKKSGKGARECRKEVAKDAYDSGSNASSSRSRGPYIAVRGPHDSPLSVSVMNAGCGGEEEGESGSSRRKGEEFRNGLRRARGLHCSTLGLRYDATTPDATWLCAFCQRGPHAHSLGDLFGPYTIDTDCDEYRALDEATRNKQSACTEVWFHEECALWAPGVVACGARVWGLAAAVWGSRGCVCDACGRPGAAVACGARACTARVHVPCATLARWTLSDLFRAHCAMHA